MSRLLSLVSLLVFSWAVLFGVLGAALLIARIPPPPTHTQRVILGVAKTLSGLLLGIVWLYAWWWAAKRYFLKHVPPQRALLNASQSEGVDSQSFSES